MQQVVPWISSLLTYMGEGAMQFRRCFLTRIGQCVVRRPSCYFLLVSGACLRALFATTMESFKSKFKGLCPSRGCFGCFSKPTIIGVGEPPKGSRIRDRTGKRSSITDDFWSSSADEMDNSLVASQWSVSSIGPVDQPTGSASTPSEFVNHGLALWNQTRQQWVGSKKSVNKAQVREPTISWNASYESLLGTNKPFRGPIPLAEMVDFLVEIWDQEGLYN